ncbi:MAG: hypothetical protein CSA72_02670 [Rhodobacterales bacterium]|nr:MAG: hypothetical protein CSA72_02670 [Rhodobacterales bacterium]
MKTFIINTGLCSALAIAALVAPAQAELIPAEGIAVETTDANETQQATQAMELVLTGGGLDEAAPEDGDSDAEVTAELKQQILTVLSRSTRSVPGLALVNRAQPVLSPEDMPSHAETPADPGAVRSAYRLAVHIPDSLTEAGLLGNGAGLVEVQLKLLNMVSQGNTDDEAEIIAERSIKVAPDEIDILEEPVRDFLLTALELKPEPVPEYDLRMWVESLDESGEIKPGAQVQLYYTATRDGYFSLFQKTDEGFIERLRPNDSHVENFVVEDQIYAVGPFTLTEDSQALDLRAIITRVPSSISKEDAQAMGFRGEPIRVIPTTSPMVFSDLDGQAFFALPDSYAAEARVNVTFEGN